MGHFYQQVWEYRGYALVTRPDTPNYHAAWCKPGTRRYRRRSLRTPSLTEAKERLIALAEERLPGAKPPPHRVGVIELLRHYLPSLEGRAGKTAGTTALKHWSAFCELHDIHSLSELTPALQRVFVEWRREQLIAAGYTGSNGTIMRDIGVLRAALRYAWKTGRLSEAPPLLTVSQPPPRERFLSEDEVTRLINACDKPHLRLFVMMALHTLQRPSAILDLTVDRVDLVRGTIDFNPPDRVRTRKGRSVVRVTETLRPLLEDAIANSLSGRVIEWDGKPLKGVRSSFRAARSRAGLGPDVSPYTLRHTGATHLAARGVPLRQIAGMLGHTDTRTTERHYAKHSPGFMGEAAAALDELFRGTNALRIAPPPALLPRPAA